MWGSESLAQSSLTKSSEDLPREDRVGVSDERPQLINMSARAVSLAIRMWLTRMEWRSEDSLASRNCILHLQGLTPILEIYATHDELYSSKNCRICLYHEGDPIVLPKPSRNHNGVEKSK